jgi:guanylate kinase
MQDDRLDVTVVFISASSKTRLLRQLNREDNPDVEEIIRRYGADEADFQALGIGYKYLTLDNNSSDKTQLDVVCEKLFEITQSQIN